MPRYEFSEGSSNKFWEINLSGKSFTTTYGKIGTDGQTTIKTWKDNAEAKKEYDKLVAEKTKKGYALVGGDDEDDEDAVPVPVAAPTKVAKADSKPVKAVPRADSQPVKMPVSNGTRHFEFSEGTSNKFWEITLSGSDVKTRYGKIGTTGQQTLKELGTAAAAQKEYDKLIAEKTKKGYVEGEASNDHFEEIEE
jgi:predicted DNA-binding WGR domain protein